MSGFSTAIGRVSFLSGSYSLVRNLQNDQTSLQSISQQLSSGQRLSQASDDPAAAVGILRINQQVATNTQYKSNLDFASGSLNLAGSTLSSLATLVTSAQSASSSMIGPSVTADERTAEASVVDNLISQVLSYSNTQYQNQSLFGGLNTQQNAFNGVAGGYKYQGTSGGQSILTPSGGTIPYTIDGSTIFGGVASQIGGGQSIGVALTGNTRISDLGGAANTGVSLGTVNVTVGGTTVGVDLSSAATANDVVNLVNAGLTSAGSNATISIAGSGFTVNGDTAQSVTIADTSQGHTAANLGIAGTFAASSTTAGGNVHARIIGTTPLSALNGGAGLDPSGFIITSGTGSTATTATITLGSLNTVQDLVNAINSSNTNVTAQINANGNGIVVDNNLSGVPVTIGENGGLTATQLGIRSLNANTSLSDLNDGAGITFASATTPGAADIQITRQDGVAFTVNLTGAQTIQDVLNRINTATGNTGATHVLAQLNTTGNGIELVDNSAGAGALAVSDINGSNAAQQLGILKTASAPTSTINGDDVNPVQPQGLFTSLIKLRNALLNNDTPGITAAGTLLQNDLSRITQVQGVVGAQQQDLQNRTTALQDDQTQLQSSLSLLQDTDMTTVITQFQQLQTAYTAALQIGAKQYQSNLLDFIQ
ncbi:MAG TPA: flagellar hook-associated protein FlgL [Phycisphaerae bacterium]|nr:flagellar hook-associated protein FlgL [Phycisphaerae bacterium]